MEQMHKKSLSWGMIALIFILFFPVGAWLASRKILNEKYNYLANGKALRIFGILMLCLGACDMMLEIALEDSAGFADATSIFCCAAGIYMIFKGSKWINRGNKFQRYVAIVNAGTTSIDGIAATYPTTYDDAVADLQMMMKAGYFLNAYLDLNKRELVMPEAESAPHTNTRPRIVQCPNCGASNTVMPGAANACEYCGSPL